MKKPIGFRSYQNDEEPDKRDELEKQQAERQKAIANFIGQNYSPIGTTSQKCYKTTAELVYELSNIVDDSVNLVSLLRISAICWNISCAQTWSSVATFFIHVPFDCIK